MAHHIWCLGEAGPDNLGLAVSDDGLLLGRTPLVEWRGDRFVVRERDEIERLLQHGYRYLGEADRLMSGLAVVARALNTNDQGLARIAAVHLKIPDLPGPIAREAMETEDRLIKYGGWDPEKHPRTGAPPNPGWFASTGGGDEDGAAVSGETAGHGALGVSLLGPVPAASFLGGLTAAQLAELGAYAARLLGPGGAAAAAFGLLFVPSPNNVHAEGDVPEIPGLRYSWNRDETQLHLTYDDANGVQRTFVAVLDGEVFRDEKGQVIGRVLSNSTVAIDAAAVSSDLVDEDEPRLCPDPVKDKRTNDRGLAYENYIKSIVNPGNPTPPYMGYQLPNVAKAVTFDDCEHSTGTMVEIKDGYAKFLESDWGQRLVEELFLKQATDQIQAAGSRSVRWYFSQKEVADYAREIFRSAGLQNIEIMYQPWPGRGK